MKHIFILIIILFSVHGIFAQEKQDTVFTYYDVNWNETAKENAFFKRNAYQSEKKTWIARGYYSNGYVQTITEFTDKALSDKNGEFVAYYVNGNKESKGEYLHNKQNGIWTYYYDNGNKKTVVNILNEKLEGKFVKYFKDGIKDQEGEYHEGKLNGNLYVYDKTHEGYTKMKYKNDSVIETHFISFNLDNEFNPFEEDLSRNHIKKEKKPLLVVEKMPEFPGGSEELMKYLSKNIDYPEDARHNAISGTVIVKYVINEDGSISDVKVVRGIGGGCDEEALRVIKGMPRWKPGTQNNKPVPVYFQLPIKFTLK